MHTDVILINEKKRSWIREQEGGYERIWTEESKNIIIISKTVRNNFKISIYVMKLTFPIRGRKGKPRITFQWRHLGNFICLLYIFIQLMYVLLNTFCSTRDKLEPSGHPVSFVVHVNSYRWCMKKLLWLHLNELYFWTVKLEFNIISLCH